MADRKVSELTAATVVADGDELYIRDVSEPVSAESKRITIANFKIALGYWLKTVQVMTDSDDMSFSPAINIPTKVWS